MLSDSPVASKVDTYILPGAIGWAHRCPNCSRGHAERDHEKDEPMDIPSTCRRCGAPMDRAKAKDWADNRAVTDQQLWPHLAETKRGR